MHIFSVLKQLLKTEPKEKSIELSKNNKQQTSNLQEEKKKNYKSSTNAQFKKPYVEENSYKDASKKIITTLNSCYVLFPKDGDTFLGMHNNEKKVFRLAGIDAPEVGSPWAKEATNFLKDKIGKKVVYLDFLGKDTYDREIVEVFLDKEKTQHVNKMLISLGLATSERYTNAEQEKTHSFVEYVGNEVSETIAKVKGNGMWQPFDESSMFDTYPETPVKKDTPEVETKPKLRFGKRPN
jgi:endonuclease YncB( thermonuclease family)